MLKPRWRKVVRDLWGNKARTILVVLAIAVGVFAFASAFITRDVLLTDMNAQFLDANVSCITIGLEGFDEDLVRWARRQEHVADAEGESDLLVKLVAGDEKYNLILRVVPGDADELSVNRVTLQEGAWPSGRREIALERTSVPFAEAEPGETVTIELTNGRQRELTLTGVVHDIDVEPAHMWPELNGYISAETLEWLGYSADFNELVIIVDDETHDIDQIGELADDLVNQLKLRDVEVHYMWYQPQGEHWAADPTKAFVTILSGIGLFSLLLSGFLVVNTITALLAQQKRQIGMMKAIGATGGQVTRVYVVMVVVFGLLALVVALPAGAGLAYVITLAGARYVNVDVQHFHVPLWVFLLEVGVALFAPVVAALFPILSGTRVTAYEAISDYGLGIAQAKRGLLDRLLARVRGLPRPALLSLRNTFQRKGRLALTLGTLTLAGALFIGVVNVRRSMLAEMEDELAVYQYDAIMFLDDQYLSRGVESRALRVPGVTRAESRTGVGGSIIRADGSTGTWLNVSGLPPDTTLFRPNMEEGRWLQPGDTNALVVSTELLRDEPDIRVGDTLTLERDEKREDWEVVGILKLRDSHAYASFDYVSRIAGSHGVTSVLYVGLERRDVAFQNEVSAALEDRLKEAGIGVDYSIIREDIVEANTSQTNFLVQFLFAMAALVALVGALGLAGTMSLNVLERTREIGVMRALGAWGGAVRAIVISEGMLVGLMSWLLAIPLAVPISLGFCAAVGGAFSDRALPFEYSPLGVFIWLGLVALISTLASLMPAQRAASISVREALAYE